MALAAIPLILLLLGYLLSVEFEHSQRLRGEVDKSYQARLGINQVLMLHQDIETGQRGYVMTGDPSFLEPFEAARTSIGESLSRLRRNHQGEEIAREVDRLRTLSTAKLRFSEETVRTRQAGDSEQALAMIKSGRGKTIMDAIRHRIARIDAAEQARLQASTDRAEASRIWSQRLTFGLLTALAILLFAAAWANNRSMRAKQVALRRLQDLSIRQEAIFDSAKDGMITLNASGSIESLNPAAARMYGYETQDLVRRDVGLLFEIAPDQGQIETFLKRLQNRRLDDLGRVQEFWAKRRDGTTFPTEVAISPVPLANGTRYLAVIRDLTDRKQIEQMKSEFVSTVSHELRTPLTSIMGSLGMLAGGAAGTLPDKAARLIDIAFSNSERLVRLINDILDIEKIEAGRMNFSVHAVPLPSLLDQAIQANRAYAEGLGVELILDPLPEDASVLADYDRMMQVITNLISNAAKYSPRDGEVRITVQPLDRRFRITVADQGPGIPEDFRPRIFSKFAQADATDTRQKGGTGLGLSIVKEIVTRLGGEVSFDSIEGKGTCFHVDLPAVEQGPAIKATDADLQPLDSPGGARILHVDDDPDMLRLVASAFEGKAEILSTPSVHEAKAAILRFHFDAVILDIALPDGNGLDLIPLLRSGQSPTPIVIFTAQDADPTLAASVDAVLTKSRASLQLLVETVDLCLPALGMRRRKGES
ncbi:ATP-binding protein [Sphingosinicella rhizophila]|uniref:histidine kinase n=1 Tax=Sphingosinicella rhizophila TaxID=3050082 RepID=A0ABU3QBB7_9SPHN|nr:ATP-binding protein [Sphingosinicella sp. GR2756]MDT9600674.1 CHASE3 domain-containing protein [Sphingosinicella sp. GR2756]